MKLDIEDLVYSTQDLRAVILDVQKYSRWFSQYSNKKRISDSQSEPAPTLSEVAVGIIKDFAKETPINQNSLDELVKYLNNIATESPRITITLAAVPPLKLKKLIVVWCRKNIKPNILVDFKFNSTLLGGMVIHYGSHVYDWSFRKQIMAKRQNFPEALRHV